MDMNKVLLPPLHIKLGLMKNFVKALHKNGAAFQHLSTVFLGLSAAKLKEGLFVGPLIREVLEDTDFFRELIHQGVGEGTTPFPGLLHFTIDSYLIMLSVKQGSVKYHFLSLWYDSTWD